ncbi:MAG: hypothetical protein JXA64_11885 [Candidatus Fermentibacteraceae bacterium]|nr:hypothetical protein [Candidatus Fermentibacteraceae bacterium]MBN2609798.1 hypothetical protein [Candidatus Fermentibacteraceae bacterium]
MEESRMGGGAVRMLRRVAAALGALLIMIAVFADLLGLSAGGGISGNQIVLAAVGMMLMAAGILGRRFPRIYRGAALLLLNVIVLLALVELASIALVKVMDRERFAVMARKREVGGDAIREWSVIVSEYVPWVLWRSTPSYPGDLVGVNGEGYRITPGASDSEDAFRVFTFGGSAMWGSCVEDSCTIPAHLQRELDGLLDRPVCISNMGQNAFTTTQEVIELILQLRRGNVPDYVVFYDGFNDVWAAYESGIAGVHHSFDPISSRIEGRDPFMQESPLVQLLHRTNTWTLISILRERGILSTSEGETALRTYLTMGLDRDSLAAEVVDICFQNYSLVEHLSDAYGFDYLMAWQPVIWCGGKELTERELSIYNGEFDSYPAGGDSALTELLRASYRDFRLSMPDTVHYADLTGVFDEVEGDVYIDHTGVHIGRDANGIVAFELLARMSIPDSLEEGSQE